MSRKSNNAKMIVGLILVIIGLALVCSLFYTIYDSIMNGNLFEYSPMIEALKFFICIIAFAAGGSLVSQYRV